MVTKRAVRPSLGTLIGLGLLAAGLATVLIACSIPLPSDAAVVQTQPSPFPVTDASGTVTAGGTFQIVFAQNVARRDCAIENPTTATEALYVHADAGSPTTANSFSLAPGSTLNCQAYGILTPDQVQVTAATTGHAFVAKSQ